MTTYRRIYVAIDDGEVYEGWTNGEEWNGWERPAFEHPEAARIAADWVHNGEATYNARSDAFCFTDAIDGVCDLYHGFDIETDEGPRHVYRVGEDWTWDEVTAAVTA